MDKNSVPARIIIVGTSTMKLAERFNQIDQEMSLRKPKSFLYDDYMGAGSGSMYSDQISRRSVRNYRDLDTFGDPMDDEIAERPRARRVDPIYSADGAVFGDQRQQRRVVGGGRPGGSRRGHPAYALLDTGAPRRVIQRPRYHEEIVEYVTVPRRQATRVIRRPAIQKRVITKIIKSPAAGGFKKGGRGGARGGAGAPRGKKAEPADILAKGKSKRAGKSTANVVELDGDLEAYMKGNKHPRVSAAQ